MCDEHPDLCNVILKNNWTIFEKIVDHCNHFTTQTLRDVIYVGNFEVVKILEEKRTPRSRLVMNWAKDCGYVVIINYFAHTKGISTSNYWTEKKILFL
jgi:hypothetical protein